MDNDFNLLEISTEKMHVDFPYTPGFLSYTELPPAMKAVQGLSEYDVLMVNGHGLAHPRGFGLASHLGLKLDKPTIGVAKRLLVGKPLKKEARTTKIMFEDKVVGIKIISPTKSPIYVSIGHMITLESCVEIVKDFFLDHTLPEPLTAAHRYSRESKNN